MPNDIARAEPAALPARRLRTLIIDNYDSYTFNLFQMIAEANGEVPLVVRNDQIPWAELERLAPFDNVVLSPGPGRPDREADFGACRDAILEARVPVLGVCLGHQGIAHVFGGRVEHAPEVMHGRLSTVEHDGSALFRGVPQHTRVVRYHSLVANPELPQCLRKTAWTPDGVVMALEHTSRAVYGVQFHPESICTQHGKQLLANFRDITAARPAPAKPAAPAALSWDECLSRLSVVPHSAPAPPPAPAAASPYPARVHHRCLELPALCAATEAVYSALYGAEADSFWLDSSRVEPGLSRFSFMGCAPSFPAASPDPFHARAPDGPEPPAGEAVPPVLRFRLGEEGAGPFFALLGRHLAALRAEQPAALPFDLCGGYVGYLGYELKEECGAGRRAGGAPLPQPDAALVLADRLLAFDHAEGRVYAVALESPLLPPGSRSAAGCARWLAEAERALRALAEEAARPAAPAAAAPGAPVEPGCSFRLARSAEEYMDDVRTCLAEIDEGETYEVCLTTQIRSEARPDPLLLYRHLRRVNPAPYAGLLRFGSCGVAVACSSPERFLRVERSSWVESKPIKGTLKRDLADPARDAALAQQLAASEKDRAENLMIVDLLRNDLGLVCDVGSVHVPKLMAIETYATVHQMVSTVRGRLRQGIASVECARSAFPGGSMTGAPKKRTMEILDRLEPGPRGVYSGTLGFFSATGAADLNIVIRTAVVTAAGTAVGAGGAVVAQSDPRGEFEEMLLKAAPVLRAVAAAAAGAPPGTPLAQAPHVEGA
eukprot:tig00000441_g721.t1